MFIRHIYKKISTPERYLYYLEDGYWFIGSRPYHHRGYFAHIGDHGCPENLDQTNETWFYYHDNKWENDDTSLVIKCA